MADRPAAKPEIGSQKRVIKLPPAIGDWTNYRPAKILVKKVKSGLYGFDRLSKEEQNDALLIHYRFIQSLLGRFKIDLGLGVEFVSCQVEQTTYLNFLRTISGPSVQGKINIPSMHEGVQFFLDLNIANSIINHALGSHDLELLDRSLTEAETTVITEAINEYLPLYALAFENSFIGPALTLTGSTEVTLDPAINTSSTFVSFSAEVAVNDNPVGKITFGYLAGPLKNLLHNYRAKKQAKPLNFGRLSPAILNRVKVPVTAILGKTPLFTSDLHHLEIGDVVALETPISSAINLSMGDFLKLLCQPGAQNKKRAVRVAGFGSDEIELTPPLATPETPEPPAEPALPEIPAFTEPAENKEEDDILKDEDFLGEDFLEEEEKVSDLAEEEDLFKEEDFTEEEAKEEK
ncbi:MAG: FliM/FliN family flagellar motor switch protein [Candidatus Margulisbacteria bacterium]|nr:FliM/FliN family flagellar motor switch protein [Candidatus Margulisiibacteriota bacterium]